MKDHSRYAFAYQLMAGIEWQYKRLSLDAGYQYFNGGRFETDNYVFASSTPVIAPFWTDRLKSNEFLQE
ncbi:hypothetical protein [Legionella hackeliae]|uniref:Uncharacterized protein n=1 Tax=Legionella hackeliae TaxID=449 RepID=A0A0A8URN4_LEGHA|nr:hypothetical protein [Legionella hackeliae]KTD13169.1 hypothetical protein Lhac_1038 [Legionella hackeliae]CEK11520.1 protein of unknown function [Legionella hackeliae]STX48288.1 Uncharacterised protein [Legionella hackeliae]